MEKELKQLLETTRFPKTMYTWNYDANNIDKDFALKMKLNEINKNKEFR